MRRILLLTAVAVIAAALAGCTYYDEPDSYTDDGYYEDDYYYEDDATGTVFDQFEELQFWGQWMDLYPYGEVWRPTVVLGWRPFDNGNWVWSADVGWTWVSYEPFGWITYHYGYWAYDAVWGWVWIPDDVWSPARVDWVVYDNYIAWAPLPPPGFRIGQPWIVTEVNVWHVVPAGDFTRPDVGRYQVAYKENYRVKGRSTVKYKSPEPGFVERQSNTVVRSIPLQYEKLGRGEEKLRRVELPPQERERVARYRENIEKRIRDTNPQPRERDSEVRRPPEEREPPETRERDTRQREPDKRDTRVRRPPERRKKDGDSGDTNRGGDSGKDRGTREPQKKKDTGGDSGKDRGAREPQKKDSGGDSGKDRGTRPPQKKKG